jgi:hypothetical protein
MNLDHFLTHQTPPPSSLSPELLKTLWQEHRHQFHQALHSKSNPSTTQQFWTWLTQEVGDSPAGRATIMGQFLKIKDYRALGQLITPNPELWNTPKLDLIDNTYENYIDYAWQYATLEELRTQHRDHCAPKPINPFPIQDKATSEQLRSTLTPNQIQALQIYYQHCALFLQSTEPHPALHTQIITEIFTPLQNLPSNPG